MKKERENDRLLEQAVNNFSNIAQSTDDPAELVGRFANDLGVEKIIWDDIEYKLQLNGIKNFLDIGCGCGALTEYSINSARINKYYIRLIDFPDVIKKLKETYINKLEKNIELYDGYFPYKIPEGISTDRYDRILVYSVLHYTDQPKLFIEKTVELLKHRGIALFADLPNNNSKGRFLASDFGRQFEANFKNEKLSAVPNYKNHKEFVKNNIEKNSRINDQLIINLLTDYRKRGYNIYICPQPITLPFCYTREDLIIQKP